MRISFFYITIAGFLVWHMIMPYPRSEVVALISSVLLVMSSISLSEIAKRKLGLTKEGYRISITAFLVLFVCSLLFTQLDPDIAELIAKLPAILFVVCWACLIYIFRYTWAQWRSGPNAT